MKEALKDQGWILPQLESNMRNQINISNIKVGSHGAYKMQSSITKLKSGTNIVGDLPIMLKVKGSEWKGKKDQILTHCLQEMNKKDKKNVVILHDGDPDFKDVGKDLKRLTKDKTVIEYPSNQGKQKDISNIKDFIEKDDHILFTERDYFNGCEASNIIYLNHSHKGFSPNLIGYRNTLMRAVQNVILVNLGEFTNITGMKEDYRFF